MAKLRFGDEDAQARGRAKGGEMIASRRFREAEARRAQLITLFSEGKTLGEALEIVGIAKATYHDYRKRFPNFASAADAARGVSRRDVEPIYLDDFIAWRKHYLLSDTTWFQAQMAEALQDDSKGGGSVTLVLFPPEHGKTTLIEDFCTWQFCRNKSYRITYGSESQTHARKALGRVRNRLEVQGPFPQLVSDFGPFAPQERTAGYKGTQAWGSDYFNIHGRQLDDERDFSMVALGFGSAIAGSRTDLLIGDDLMSMNNVTQAEKLLQTFRQDWLSRPGVKGRTVIIGTRVEDGDIYDLMEEQDLPDFIVRFKAHDPTRIALFDTPWLWPERYSPEDYAKLRKNVGEAGWFRNYQQQPRKAGDSTFTEEMVAKAENPLRSVLSAAPAEATGKVLGLDPGYGTNAIISLAGNEERCWVLGGRIDLGLTNNEQIANACEVQAFEHPDSPWLHLTIEDKAFQKGLLDDAAIKALQTAHGITISGHQTGSNKYDENIGIPAMARDFNRGIIELPGADDDATVAFMAELREQLVRWRPHRKGTALTQDLVMALWFSWLWWQKFRTGLQSRTNPPPAGGDALPWRPTVLPGGMTRMPA